MTEPNLIENRRHFNAVLVNTFIANLTTNFLWTAVVFWLYLETRSVLVTSFLMGGYLLLVAVMGVPFGSWVDRTRKKAVMVVSQTITLVLFALACGVFIMSPRSTLVTLGSAPLFAFAALLLIGSVTESARGIALSTVVTLLVPDAERAQANGLVGIVGGLGFAVTSVFAGLAVGQLGIEWCLVIAMALTVLSLLHLWTVRIPEPEIVHADGAPKPVDFVGAWRAIREVPGLIWLILFGTFNNLLGGVVMALMDPYGLTLMSVEVWGVMWGVLSFGFLVGGAWVARKGLGSRPLRSLLLANVVMWVICFGFTLRESIWLLAVGILLYMALMPIAEAAEQTVLQRVVPLPKQGRVFGLATSAEIAAMPVSAFVVGPIAEFWLIPYMETDAGRDAFGWLLGDGDARGIALVFVLASVVGLAFTLMALASQPYRTLSAAYEAAEPVEDQGEQVSEGTAPEPEAGHSRFNP
jgi:DHA3 family multidrug efflux protein-like MFS transporter